MAHYNVDDITTKGSVIKDRKHQTADIILNLDVPMVDNNGDRWEHTIINNILHLATDDLCTGKLNIVIYHSNLMSYTATNLNVHFTC